MPDLNNDKNVYLLGAGFSREAGLPLQDDFLLVAKEVFFTNPARYKHFETVFEYQDNLTKMKKFLNYPLLNLEHLFNLIEMDLFYSKDMNVANIKSDFTKLICDVLINKTPNPFYHDQSGYLHFNNTRFGHYLSFIKLLIKNDANEVVTHDDTVISFNYDLVLEGAASIYNWFRGQDKRYENRLKNNWLTFNTTFNKANILVDPIPKYFIKRTGSDYFPPESVFSRDENAVKLLKLHGSINWKTASDESKTFIVPPTWNKSDDSIRLLWEEAYKELKDAKRIIIIGYSFPETDIYVKSLLGLALNENKKLQNIYFINPDKDVVRRTCLSLLDKYFEKYCAYKEWIFSEFVGTGEGKQFIKEALNR